MDVAFELERVSVVFGGRRALDAVSLRIGAGEAVAVVGRSGAGKTTLLRLASASVLPTEGRVEVFGEPLDQVSMRQLQALRRRLATVPQDGALVGELRVLENLLAAHPHRQGWWHLFRDSLWPPRAEVLRAHGLLESLGVGDTLYLPTGSLSGGEAQRVAVARALFRRPGLLLADEPVASVDPTRAEEVLVRMLDSQQRRGGATVVSLHQPEFASAFFDRVVGLRDGRVVFDTSPAELGAEDWAELYRGSQAGGKAS